MIFPAHLQSSLSTTATRLAERASGFRMAGDRTLARRHAVAAMACADAAEALAGLGN
jgi:hypothetical protein